MIGFKRIETLQELDAVLPMIGALHKTQKYCKLFPHSGFLLWLTFNFTNLAIWVAYEDSRVVGYEIVTIQNLYTVKEALILEAFIDRPHSEISEQVFKEVVAYAMENGCQLLSMFTENDKVAEACRDKYGFELTRIHMVRRLQCLEE